MSHPQQQTTANPLETKLPHVNATMNANVNVAATALHTTPPPPPLQQPQAATAPASTSTSTTPNPIAATQLNPAVMMPNAAPPTANPVNHGAPVASAGMTTMPVMPPMGSVPSNVAAAVASSVAAVGPAGGGKEEYEEIREQDRYLPIANIARIMKNTLPDNAKIAKDSKETVQECVSEFISFITSEASDKCMQEKRKTINGDDLLWAMSTLGFDKYVEPLKIYLTKYREAIRGDKPDAKGKGGANSGSGRPSTNAAVVGSGIGLPASYAQGSSQS